MKRIFIMLLALSLLMSLAACGTTSPKETPKETSATANETVVEATPEGTELPDVPSYFGTWEVKDSQHCYISAVTQEERDSFIGKRLTYQADAVLFDGETVLGGPVTYEVDDEPTTEVDVTEDYRANLGEWWNGVSEVTGISVDASDAFFGHYFFVVDSETIWIFYEGVFFLAKRV